MSRTFRLLFLLLLLGTGFFIWMPDPEQSVLKSEDGAFQFRAVASVPLQLETDLGGPSTARLTPIYRVTPEQTLPVLGEVRLVSKASIGEAGIAVFQASTGRWDWVSSEKEGDTFVARVASSGAFALLQRQDVATPSDLGRWVNDVLLSRPDGAVAGRIEFAYKTEADDAVSLPTWELQAGCGGVFAPKGAVLAERVEKEGTVSLGTSVRNGGYVIDATWWMGEGCGEEGFSRVAGL